MIPAQSSSASVRTGALFVVSMPIGDPEDITLRALRILRGVSLIVAENARVSRALLAPHAIDAEIVSLGARHGTPALDTALAHLDAGKEVAVIADSGTPTLVDPGLRLIRLAIERGHRVTSVPGATACLAALALSGFSPTPFSFLGVPPRRLPERTTFFSHLAGLDQTVVLYESSRYLYATLTALCRFLEPTRKIVVAFDLTHKNERIYRGIISVALAEFAEEPPSGAYTLVVSGPPS